MHITETASRLLQVKLPVSIRRARREDGSACKTQHFPRRGPTSGPPLISPRNATRAAPWPLEDPVVVVDIFVAPYFALTAVSPLSPCPDHGVGTYWRRVQVHIPSSLARLTCTSSPFAWLPAAAAWEFARRAGPPAGHLSLLPIARTTRHNRGIRKRPGICPLSTQWYHPTPASQVAHIHTAKSHDF